MHNKKKHKHHHKKKPRSTLGKVWHFIWEDDSVWSWIVNIVISFILIKFIVYPGLGFALSTTHPIVAVVSGSMEHKTVHPCINYTYNRQCNLRSESVYRLCGKDFDSRQHVDLDFFWETCGAFYTNKGITKEEFSDFPFSGGFNTGDIMILKGKDPEDIKVGDILVYWGNQFDPIIHRVVDIKNSSDGIVLQAKGDHNSHSNTNEVEIRPKRIVGYREYEKGSVAVLRIPYIGYIKIGFVKMLNFIIGIIR